MRKPYTNCLHPEHNCAWCSLAINHIDCHGRPINPIKWARLKAGLGQTELAKKVGIRVDQLQRMEYGIIKMGNVTAKVFIALSDALNVDPHELLEPEEQDYVL